MQNENERQNRFLENEDKLEGFITGQKKDDEDFQSSVESLPPEAEHDYLSENQDKNMKTHINEADLVRNQMLQIEIK